MIKKILLLFIIILFIIPLASALSVYPATVCFEQNSDGSYALLDMFCKEVVHTYYPGESYNGEVCVASDETVVIDSRGDLAKYLELDKNEVIFPANATCVGYKLKLPSYDELSKYGELKTVVGVEPKLPAHQAGISVIPRVQHQILVSVPYPAVYLEAEMIVRSNTTKQPVTFNVTLNNLGRTSLTDVLGQVDIMNNATVVKTLSIPVFSIEPGKQVVKDLEWDAKAGNYTAVLHINYADKTATNTQKFEVKTNPWRFGLSRVTVSTLVLIMFVLMGLAIIVAGYYIWSSRKNEN